MNDDVIFQTQNQKDDDLDGVNKESEKDIQESDLGVNNGQVFDITPDLNISPIRDNDEGQIKVAVDSTQSPPIQNSNQDTREQNNIKTDTVNIPLAWRPQTNTPITTQNKSSAPNNEGVAGVTFNIKPTQVFTPSITPKEIETTDLPKINQNDIQTPEKTVSTEAAKIDSDNTKTATVAYQDPNIKHLRTYESDFAEALSNKKISTASIAIAEIEKRGDVAPEAVKIKSENKHVLRNSLLTVFSLIFIIGGIFTAYYLYSISAIAPTPNQPQTMNNLNTYTLVPADYHVNISVDSLSPKAVLEKIRKEIGKEQKANTIKEIVLVKNKEGKNINIPAPDMVKIMNIGAPDILLRSLSTPWMLGVYNDQNGNKDTFIVVTNNFFQNTFAGLLQWENTMAEDLRLFLNTPTYNSKNTNSPDTDSASSTEESSSNTSTSTTSNPAIDTEVFEPIYYSLQGKFIDRIIKNNDVREYLSLDGEILFLYSFINNQTLIITKEESTLSTIITRLENQSFIK